MAGGWQDLVDTLNDRFANDRPNLANEFKNKHGPNGNGGGAGQKAYKFGHFVHKNDKLNMSERASDRFLMDSGTRHWGGSGPNNPRGPSKTLSNLEAVIKHSLTVNPPKNITFTVETDYDATYATATVTGDVSGTPTPIIDADLNPTILTPASSFAVVIKCPPSP